jgi:hypothetical protein
MYLFIYLVEGASVINKERYKWGNWKKELEKKSWLWIFIFIITCFYILVERVNMIDK